jgi:hypothetical protein
MIWAFGRREGIPLKVGRKIDALYLMLRLDAQRYLSTSGTTAKALSRRCAIPDRLLRGMHEARWKPTLKTLLRVERALCDEVAWPSRDVNGWYECEDEDGFIFCRNRAGTSRPTESFDDVLEVYNDGRSDDARLGALETLSNVTIIDVSAASPTEYSIVKYSDASRAARGTDFKGKRLRDIRVKAYRDFIMQGCLRAKYAGESLFNDVVWANYGTKEGSFSQRLMLPLGQYVVSTALFQLTGYDGNLDYSSFKANLDV